MALGFEDGPDILGSLVLGMPHDFCGGGQRDAPCRR